MLEEVPEVDVVIVPVELSLEEIVSPVEALAHEERSEKATRNKNEEVCFMKVTGTKSPSTHIKGRAALFVGYLNKFLAASAAS